MLKIDAHQHFWLYDQTRHAWITPEMAALQRDFLPPHLEPHLARHGLQGTVLVQVEETPAENAFLLQQARAHDFIKGVVGWVNLQAQDLEAQLEGLQQVPKLKGFRDILQGPAAPARMLEPDFIRGLKKLNRYGFTYDLLVYARQLEQVRELVQQLPEQPFVLDHLAKPNIKSGDLADWKKQIRLLATHQNLSCKVSGLVTEADWQHWKAADFRSCLDTVVEAFGPGRLLYGSDWPVCLLAGSYSRVLGLVQDYFTSFSAREQEQIFGGNAVEFYKL
ncbi:MAG: amidohydrolase family protein [Adhaeribacter sp.]